MASIQAPSATRSRIPKLASLRAVSTVNPAVRTISRFDQILMISGLVMIPVGIITVLLGWYGASKTPWAFEQTPYVISGGLLGVGLMITGAIIYLASWISRLAGQERATADAANALLASMESGLRTLPEAVGSATGSAKTATRAAGFVATKTGSMYHRADCSVVVDRDDVRRVSATQAGSMKPCRMCEPDAS